MDEKPDQIIGQIEAQRSELGRNLNELETRVRQTTDWRTYFDKNPMLMLGAALGGGLLLGSVVSHKTSSSHRSSGTSSSSSRSRYAGSGASASMGISSAGTLHSSSSSSLLSPEHRQQLNQTMDHLKAALIGFGMAKAKEFLSQAVPGIDQHLHDAGGKFSQSHFANTEARSNSGQNENQYANAGGSWQQESSGYQGTNQHDQPAGFTPGMVP